MLTVKAERNELTRWIKLVNDPVRVLLHTRREYDNLVELCHLAQEFLTERPDQEVGFRAATFAFINIVDQCFIKVEHQGVLVLAQKPVVHTQGARVDRWKVRNLDHGELS